MSEPTPEVRQTSVDRLPESSKQQAATRGNGDDRQMLDSAGAVADFAYKQGVGDAVAVDHLIREYEAARENLREAVEALRYEHSHTLDDATKWRMGQALEALRYERERLADDA